MEPLWAASGVTNGDNSRAELCHFVPVRQNGRSSRKLENLMKRQKGGVGLERLKQLNGS
jgi:hypothetical protein